jgi:hypothetical protein
MLKFSAETSKVGTEVSLDPPAKRSHVIPEVFFAPPEVGTKAQLDQLGS